MSSTRTAAPTASRGGTLQRRIQYARWATLLEAVVPKADEDRPLCATEAARGALPPVQARDADLPRQTVAGA